MLITTKSKGDISNVNRIISYSCYYDKELINNAFDIVMEEFANEFEGCTLVELRYDEQAVITEIGNYIYENNRELIVLFSTFNTDAKGGDGSLNPDDTYTNWKWYLVRTEDMQSWEIIDWGY